MKFKILLTGIMALLFTYKSLSQNSSGGNTQDILDVSLSGGASYSVPITTLPGVNGVKPNISLSFDSQAGNGIAGYGWNLNGISSITRIPSTIYHDNVIDPVDFDDLDRFALDGKRLLLKSGSYGAPGSVYQTEDYSNIKIRAVGESRYGANYGPKYFIVHFPNGNRAWFGSGNSHGRLEYSISKWQDTQGNTIKYSYLKQASVLRISTITYGSNLNETAPFRISFSYGNRNRIETSYFGDIRFENSKILDAIYVNKNGALYRRYAIEHKITSLGYMTIQSIQEGPQNSANGFPEITFDYGNTPVELNKIDRTSQLLDIDPEARNANTLTGDFDGDGKMDVLFYDKQAKNKLYVFNDLQNNTDPSFSWELNSGNFDAVIARNALNTANKFMGRQGITTIKDTYFSGINSEVSFRTYAMTSYGQAFVQSQKTWNAPTYKSERGCDDDFRLRTTKKYISGDFNGDAITDVIALTFPYMERLCNPTTDCDPDNPQQATASAAVGDCCECTDYPRTVAKSYFIDLDRTKTSNFSSYSGQIERGISINDPIFAADFDGDGKSELIHVTEGKIEVYSLGSDKILRLMHAENDNLIKINAPVLPGDYNGDGKLDLLFPLAEESEVWRFYISTGTDFQPHTKDINIPYRVSRQVGNFLNEYHYIVQDFNADGKTDILNHFVSSPVATQIIGGEEWIKLYNNAPTTPNTIPAFELAIDQVYGDLNRKPFGIPIFLETDSQYPNLEYAFISNKKITSWALSQDHREDTRLYGIQNHGITTDISYSDVAVEPFTNNTIDAYYSDILEVYPYVNVNHAAGYKVVASLQQQGSGLTRRQDFKYKGAVSHATGLGFLGFKQRFKTNWYGDGVTQLWHMTKNSPQLRGAPIQKWTANFESFNPYNYISKTDYDYTTLERTDKVFINVPRTTTVDEALSGYTETTNIVYNSYYDPIKITTVHPDGSEIEEYTYSNRPGANNQNYHIGRPKTKVMHTTIGNNTFTEEEEHVYANNLVRTLKRKGMGTEWMTIAFDHDRWGNTIERTLSGGGQQARSTYFDYGTSGLYLESSIDIEGFETTYAHTEFGFLADLNDRYGRTTSYEYDEWGRVTKETDYLGKSSVITYGNTVDGGFEVLTDYDQGNDTKAIFNAFGWMTELHTLSLNSKWIVTRYEYDTAGRQTKTYEPYFATDAGNQFTSTNYDEYGRPITVILYTGEIQNMSYNGLTVTVADGTKTVVTTTDTFGNIVERQDPGGSVSYTYHGNGAMKTADYGGHRVESSIDAWGRKTRVVDPAAGTHSYEYDFFGDLTKEITPKGTFTYAFSPLGKLERATIVGDETDMVIDYRYNSDKLLEQVTGTDNTNQSSYTYGYSYDDYKRPSKVVETTPFVSFSREITYDDFGRPWRETNTTQASDGTTVDLTNRNVYDTNSGLLKEIRDASTNQRLWRLNAHDARGHVTRIVLGNGFRQNRDYDAYGLPKTVRDVKGSGNTQQRALRMNYTFDAQRGVLDSRRNIDLNWTENFGYDNLDRLTTISGAVQKTQDYDTRGRITNNSAIGAYNYMQGNIYQLLDLDLNENGANFYSGRERRELTYNAFKKPVEVFEENKGRVNFGYSPLMTRSQSWYGGVQEDKEQRRFRKHYSAISPVEIIEDRQTNNTKIITYIGGDAYSATVAHIETSDDRHDGYHYLHRDYLGSILAITNDAGAIIERAQFGAWGRVDYWVDGNGEPLLSDDDGTALLLGRGYTGHEHFFSIGLIHMNGRMYDAELGRFLSTDPYISDPFDTQNFDRYVYVLNNPLSNTDITGNEPGTVLAIILAVVFVASAALGLTAFQDSYSNDYNSDISNTGLVPNNNSSSSSMINDSPIPPWRSGTFDPPLFRTNDFQYSEPGSINLDRINANRVWDHSIAESSQNTSFSITTEDALRTAADFTPFVGSGLDIIEGVRDGDGWQVAMGVGFLILDVATLGGSSIVRGVVKTGIKVGSKAVAKNAAKANGRVFWSGGNNAKNAAEAFARANNAKTLEMTGGGRVMNALNPVLPRAISKPIWNKMSSKFARGTRGPVNVFHNATDGIRINSVWGTIEYDILKNNNVEILYHNVFR